MSRIRKRAKNLRYQNLEIFLSLGFLWLDGYEWFGKNRKKDTISINGKEKLEEYIDGQTDELGNLPAAAA